MNGWKKGRKYLRMDEGMDKRKEERKKGKKEESINEWKDGWKSMFLPNFPWEENSVKYILKKRDIGGDRLQTGDIHTHLESLFTEL